MFTTIVLNGSHGIVQCHNYMIRWAAVIVLPFLSQKLAIIAKGIAFGTAKGVWDGIALGINKNATVKEEHASVTTER